MKDNIIAALKAYVRATNYLTVAQIYLQDNFLLERKLAFDDIKPRLLGHWGTCPGINFIYAHLNYLIKKHHIPMIFVLGPGHGFPALQANLFLEGTLRKFYNDAQHTEAGLRYLIKNFSWPYGFPSHSYPGTPGVIAEGGELGYALSTAYGAILDNPRLIAACVIGDGEAETGATATAWHINKFIDPRKNGAVLPILHLNGYKISGPSIFGRMSNQELIALFRGYGYRPFIVEGKNIYEKMRLTLEKCHKIIHRFPMIILKTPKGWTGIKYLNGSKIEGNCLSHQVVAKNAKTEASELHALQKWLRSYDFNELFSKTKGFNKEINRIIPLEKFKMGNPEKLENKNILWLPKIEQFAEDAKVPGTIGSSSMRRAGLYLSEVFLLNKKSRNFRLFSPDETYSNKLDAVFEHASRAFVWPRKSWDKNIAPTGEVIEMLSEHTLQGLLQGYVLTGRHGIFTSYEAFIQIVSSMTDQYIKFLRIAREIPWHKNIPSLNYILTSSGWRQEHNGFSHQNPGFISNILQKYDDFIHVYFPPDGNSMLAVLEKCLLSRREVNVIVAGKTQEPRWLTPKLAKKELADGLMIWEFVSDPEPDIVLAAVGDYMTKESLAAIKIIKAEAPTIKIRFVNIMELSTKCEKNLLNDTYFTKDKPVIFNFHGYPSVLQQMLFAWGNTARFSIHGYIEQGSTTTPFDMHVRNGTSRWHLAKEVFSRMGQKNIISLREAEMLNQKYDQKFKEHRAYIQRYGVDMPEIDINI